MHDVVLDTSVLIATDKLGIQHLLPSVYAHILVPAAVANEYGTIQIPVEVVAHEPLGLYRLLHDELNLGAGESAAIALASTRSVSLLVDDMRARKIATELGLQISGTIGVLLKIERSGHKGFSAYDHAMKLRSLGFYLSEQLLTSIRHQGLREPDASA